jgi:hypothetical protein
MKKLCHEIRNRTVILKQLCKALKSVSPGAFALCVDEIRGIEKALAEYQERIGYDPKRETE